jgi:hypothetical protein
MNARERSGVGRPSIFPFPHPELPPLLHPLGATKSLSAHWPPSTRSTHMIRTRTRTHAPMPIPLHRYPYQSGHRLRAVTYHQYSPPLPTTASYHHSNDSMLYVPPCRPHSVPTVFLSSQNTPSTRLPFPLVFPHSNNLLIVPISL